MRNPGKNLLVKPIKLTTEICNEICNKINNDFSTLDPKINYTIEIIKKSEQDSNRIEVRIHDREFILSPFFADYLITTQIHYLWSKQYYDVTFIYTPN